MTAFVTPSFGAFLPELGEAKQVSISRLSDVRNAPRQQSGKQAFQQPLPRQPHDEKYPRWAVTLFVVGFCVAFWGAVAWAAIGLFN